MKTRADIFYKSEEILSVITLYKALKLKQILNIYPNKENTRHSINTLIKSKRVFYCPETDIVSSIEEQNAVQNKLIQSFWVLLDFIEKVEHHFMSDFPIQISFFKSNELYEILYVSLDEENLINTAINTYANSNNTDIAKRLVIVENKEQISKINIKNTICYCQVIDEKVTYWGNAKK